VPIISLHPRRPPLGEDIVAVERAHAAGQQHHLHLIPRSATVGAQQVGHQPRCVHSVDHHAEHPAVLTGDGVGGLLGDGLGELSVGLAPIGGHLDRFQPNRLACPQSSGQRLLAGRSPQRRGRKPSTRQGARGSAELNDLATGGQRGADGRQFADRGQRLGEGLAEMHLVQQKQDVVAQQAGMDRKAALRHPVAPEKQSGTHLVHRRGQQRGHVRSKRPGVVTNHAPAQQPGDQRGSIGECLFRNVAE